MSNPSAPSELEKRSTETTVSTLKFSVLRLALAFVIAGVSDVIGAFAITRGQRFGALYGNLALR